MDQVVIQGARVALTGTLQCHPHWSDRLMESIRFSDKLHFLLQEAIPTQEGGEQGEQEAVRSSEGNSPGPIPTTEDAGEEILAAEAGGVQDLDGPGGVPTNTE